MSCISDNRLRVCGIVDGTTVDGPGLRTSIYFAGCRHHCPGCHNPSTWDFNAGTELSAEYLMERIADNGFAVTFTGGDPMYSATALLPLAKRICNAGLNLWIYTGFTIEEIFSAGGDMAALADMADVIVDGPFIESLKDTRLLFRGSSNQRLVDMTATKKKRPRSRIHPDFLNITPIKC